MKRILSFGGILALLIALIVTIGVPNINANTAHQLKYSDIDSEQLFNSSSQDNNPEIKIKHLSDEEFRQKIDKLWGSEVASKVKRINKTVDLNLQEDGVRFITPTNLSAVNWCGYWLINTGIHGVISWWNASQVTGNDGYDGSWIGIGGGDGKLLQTGIDMKNMEAWVEALPGSPQYLFDVNDGDEIHASIGIDEDNPGYWFVAIVDQTTYDSWGDDVYYNPSSKACWIVETPYKGTVPQTQYHIGDFDTVYFTECQWWDSSLTYHDMNWGTGTLYKITETTLNNETMAPSNIGGDGESFSVNDP